MLIVCASAESSVGPRSLRGPAFAFAFEQAARVPPFFSVWARRGHRPPPCNCSCDAKPARSNPHVHIMVGGRDDRVVGARMAQEQGALAGVVESDGLGLQLHQRLVHERDRWAQNSHRAVAEPHLSQVPSGRAVGGAVQAGLQRSRLACVNERTRNSTAESTGPEATGSNLLDLPSPLSLQRF